MTLNITESQAALLWLILKKVSASSGLPNVREDLREISIKLDAEKGYFEDVLVENMDKLVLSGDGVYFY